MIEIKNISNSFQACIEKLGFSDDDSLYLVDQNQSLPDPQIRFHIETANYFKARAVYLRKQINGSYKPQVYIYDFTDRNFQEIDEHELTQIHKILWSSGEAPLACIFYNTEIKILDCTRHITKDYKPEYLIKHLKLAGEIHHLYNQQFATKIKTGIFWDEEEYKNKFKFQNSAYDQLIVNIRHVVKNLTKEYRETSAAVVNKIIVQAILIKYLEERNDDDGNRLLAEKYFQKYEGSNTFNDVLRVGNFVELLLDLNKDFNGNVFKWELEEQNELKDLDLTIVADLLATDKTDLGSDQMQLDFPDWRYFEFKYIPVELISRLYEEFLGQNKKENGLFYTPSHLAKLLVDECLPLKKYREFDLSNFRILDPACGSGIFLVVAFKRLVQMWRLQNNMKFPEVGDLKLILRNIYGVDKEEQAVRLSSFSLSLALCNELNPIKIINELTFDDLSQKNLVHSDFFHYSPDNGAKFHLIIGNPPFVRGALTDYSTQCVFGDKKVKIPQGQIALKFLAESFNFLETNGLVCLIIKSSGLLYNTTSSSFKKGLFSNFNAIQILDFTALARNKALWDNGADVASAAIFIRNQAPDPSTNILHITFRRTKATKERLIFEIDEYDLNYIDRPTAIGNEFIWKNNLLGGGRIRNVIEKVRNLPVLEQVLIENDSIIEEGLEVGSKPTKSPNYMFNRPILLTAGISEDEIYYDLLRPIDASAKFTKVPSEHAVTAPNLIIWENIGEKRFPIFFNERSFTFKRRLVSIKSLKNDKKFLLSIESSFERMYAFYKFYFLATSSETLINRNNTFLLRDLKNIPFVGQSFDFSVFDNHIINDTIGAHQDFFIHGEKSKSVLPIRPHMIEEIVSLYGQQFSAALNLVYGDYKLRNFRLSDVVKLENSLLAVVFKYDAENSQPVFHTDRSTLDVGDLITHEVSLQLSIRRIIKLYPKKNTIVFVKPNQYRYWLPSIAYRDADKCFLEISKIVME